jgi:hypothetical protein
MGRQKDFQMKTKLIYKNKESGTEIHEVWWEEEIKKSDTGKLVLLINPTSQN